MVMSFSSGTITFKRFFVNGAGVARVDEALLEQLKGRAMGTGSVRTADQTEIGWVTGEHILDTDFTFEKNAIADGLHFALRVDTNKVPGDLVRSYQKINEQAMLAASGRDFISKVERREAREQALARADTEARSGAHSRMKLVPVFGDLKRNEVYLGSAGSGVIDQFILLFRETFDRTVVAATAGEIAARWSATAGEMRAFDDCEPAHWINPPEGADTQAEVIPVNEARSKDFLGTEWLGWLWYSSHVESPEIATQLGQSVTVLFEKSLQLDCAFKISGSLSIRADAPTRLAETLVALAGGKRPVRAGLHIAASGGVFSFGIRCDAMNYASVQVPQPEEVENARLVFEDRIEKLRDLIEASNDLYTAFLRRRMSNKWTQVLSAMRTWIAAGQAGPENIRVAS